MKFAFFACTSTALLSLVYKGGMSLFCFLQENDFTTSMQKNDYLGSDPAAIDFTVAVKRSRNPLKWWYRLSCPPEPADSAPLIEREKFRRGRIVSIITLLLQIFVITSIPAGFSGTNHTLLYLMVFAFIANIIAMFLNRREFVLVAALILVFNVEISMGSNVLTTPGGLSLATLPLFDLLVIPLVLAASVLPIWYVFAFAALNSLFGLAITLNFFNLPQAPDLAPAIHASTFSLVSLPVFIQFILAFIAFLWVRSANEAIARADRAEQIAMLEHDIAESRQEIAEQKEQLESAVQEVSQALLAANSGQGSPRISTQGNVLWVLVGPINNLIARMQRLRHIEEDQKRLTIELEQLLRVLQTARQNRQPVTLPSRGQGYRLGSLYEEISYLQGNKQLPPAKNSGTLNTGHF